MTLSRLHVVWNCWLLGKGRKSMHTFCKLFTYNYHGFTQLLINIKFNTWFSSTLYITVMPSWLCIAELHDVLPLQIFVCFWRDSLQWVRASLFTRFLDHTQWRTTVGRTPPDEWSARRRDLYLTSHTTDKHLCPRWHSIPQSQQASGHRPKP